MVSTNRSKARPLAGLRLTSPKIPSWSSGSFPVEVDRDALSDGVFIPVVIDAERVVDGEEMVRVTYFAVTTDAPAAVWEVELPAVAQLHGIGALGLAGVVYGALRDVGGPGNDTVDVRPVH